MTSIWWIRRDLRLTDNPALHSALEAGSVLPVFILDPAFSSSSPRRKNFLHEGLHALDKDLRARVTAMRKAVTSILVRSAWCLDDTVQGNMFKYDYFSHVLGPQNFKILPD